MQFRAILTSFVVFSCLALPACAHSPKSRAKLPTDRDAVITDMAQAYKNGDTKRLTALLPKAQGHILEPWAAYWELSARLGQVDRAQVEAFLGRYAGTYQEDRLRNEWLQVLGKRRDWTAFEGQYALYRMQDDPETKCYALFAAYALRGDNVSSQVRDLWLSQREADEGCSSAAATLIQDKKMEPLVAWQRARLGFEFDKPRIAQQAVAILNPDWADGLDKLYGTPKHYLDEKLTALRLKTREWVTLALIRLASSDPDVAADEMDKLRWRTQLTAEEKGWLWGVIGKRSARMLSAKAMGYFVKGDTHFMHSDHLGWRVRAALRANDWAQVNEGIAAMGEPASRDPAWIYWRARAVMAIQGPLGERTARTLFQSIASSRGFYEQLAQEELGQRVVIAPPPAPTTVGELQGARDNPGLKRAMAALQLGLRSEGVREWNYSITLFKPDGMSDRELQAAATLACEQQIWDRCINTSERMRGTWDAGQRFPTPFKNEVVRRAQQINLDPAYVYGLIRQESRFVMDARSNVGASGLMQVMPRTAKWTAKKLGMNDFKVHELTDRDTNIAIGTGYLKLVLDAFDGSMSLAAAAYNAGPNRARQWRGQAADPVLETAIWAENIPFPETRDYVKKVISNTVVYAAVLTGQAQSIKERLGFIAPLHLDEPPAGVDLP